jgi:hypothetical protein
MRRDVILGLVVLVAACGGGDGGGGEPTPEPPELKVGSTTSTQDSLAFITDSRFRLRNADGDPMEGIPVKFFYPVGYRISSTPDSTSSFGDVFLVWKVAKSQTPGTYVARACAYLTPADSVCDVAPHVTITVP